MFNNKTILITGGTGSFGKAFSQHLRKNYKPKKIIISAQDFGALQKTEVYH